MSIVVYKAHVFFPSSIPISLEEVFLLWPKLTLGYGSCLLLPSWIHHYPFYPWIFKPLLFLPWFLSVCKLAQVSSHLTVTAGWSHASLQPLPILFSSLHCSGSSNSRLFSHAFSSLFNSLKSCLHPPPAESAFAYCPLRWTLLSLDLAPSSAFHIGHSSPLPGMNFFMGLLVCFSSLLQLLFVFILTFSHSILPLKVNIFKFCLWPAVRPQPPTCYAFQILSQVSHISWWLPCLSLTPRAVTWGPDL